jgi:hypothetical protein
LGDHHTGCGFSGSAGLLGQHGYFLGLAKNRQSALTSVID